MQDKSIISTVDSDGVVQSQFMVSQIGNKHKIAYEKNKWCALNQPVWKETTMGDNGLYTVKGLVLNYLIGTMRYGNFSAFKGSHIAKQLNVSPQAVSKAKRELIDDGYIMEGIDLEEGTRGVIITSNLVDKPSETSSNIVTLEQWKAMEE